MPGAGYQWMPSPIWSVTTSVPLLHPEHVRVAMWWVWIQPMWELLYPARAPWGLDS